MFSACLVGLGEIERQNKEYVKARWSYADALRYYKNINHSYGVELCTKVLSEIDKERITGKSKKLETCSHSRKNPKYRGGMFIRRWDDKPSSLIIEVAKVTNGSFKID